MEHPENFGNLPDGKIGNEVIVHQASLWKAVCNHQTNKVSQQEFSIILPARY